ncbi:hypothetical protein DTM11_27615 [Escherichia coli]|nr:hypothetical protein DTM11_27615 [Escherichia coli]
MLGGADNPNGELLSYIIGADRKTTHAKTTDVIAACGRRFRETMNHERNAECTDLSSRPQPAAGAGLAGRDGC